MVLLVAAVPLLGCPKDAGIGSDAGSVNKDGGSDAGSAPANDIQGDRGFTPTGAIAVWHVTGAGVLDPTRISVVSGTVASSELCANVEVANAAIDIAHLNTGRYGYIQLGLMAGGEFTVFQYYDAAGGTARLTAEAYSATRSVGAITWPTVNGDGTFTGGALSGTVNAVLMAGGDAGSGNIAVKFDVSGCMSQHGVN